MKAAAAAISGLYAVTPDLADTALLLRRVEAALSGGVRLLQYRNKTADATLRLAQARALKALCGRYGAKLIVNDHVDIAQAADADGVHVGREDAAARTARAALGKGRIVGVSCYNELGQALAAVADGADYVAFGTFFPSSVKPDAVHAPLELLPLAKRRLSVPVVAIGGITLDNAPVLIGAGVDSLAVISALFGAEDVAAAARAFCQLFTGEKP